MVIIIYVLEKGTRQNHNKPTPKYLPPPWKFVRFFSKKKSVVIWNVKKTNEYFLPLDSKGFKDFKGRKIFFTRYWLPRIFFV